MSYQNTLVDLLFVSTVNIPNLNLRPCLEVAYILFLTNETNKMKQTKKVKCWCCSPPQKVKERRNGKAKNGKNGCPIMSSMVNAWMLTKYNTTSHAKIYKSNKIVFPSWRLLSCLFFRLDISKVLHYISILKLTYWKAMSMW